MAAANRAFGPRYPHETFQSESSASAVAACDDGGAKEREEAQSSRGF
jgi:hypothetical protein